MQLFQNMVCQRNRRIHFSFEAPRSEIKHVGLICLVKKRKIHFRILSDLRTQSWIHHDPRDIGLMCLVKTRKIGGFFLNLTV